MLPTINGVRLTEQNGSVKVSGRNLVPIELEPDEVQQVEAVHLGTTTDNLALAVKDLGDAGFVTLQMKTAQDGAPVDRVALYRFANGTHRNGRMGVRPPRQRQPIDIRSEETVLALNYFMGSGKDYGLTKPAFAQGLNVLEQHDFRFHPDGVDAIHMSPFKAYERDQKLLWVSHEGGPHVPFKAELAERPDELRHLYQQARELDQVIPKSLTGSERAALWEAGYAGRDPDTRLRCLAKLTQVAPLKQAVEHYDAVSANFDNDQHQEATRAFVELAAIHGTQLAAESLPLMAVQVETESLQQRAELFGEILRSPAGQPGATPTDRRIDYVRGAIQRFAENDPASARARLSNIFVLERGHKPPEQAQAIGTNEGRLVIGGVLVRGKR